MELAVRDIIKTIKGQMVLGDPKTKVFRASCNSRQIKKGDIFFALKGSKQDGHDFALAASREGASALVVTQLDWMKSVQNISGAVIRVKDTALSLQLLGQQIRMKFKGPVVGITGSNGKTTTKQMAKSVLSGLGEGLATRGNYNSQIGLPLVLSELKPTDKWMALEMGASEPGNIHTLCEMAKPSIGVLTSIGPAHLESFGSMERIVETKWELMESLPADGVAVLPWGIQLLEKHIRSFKKKIIYFGDDSSCAVRASSISVDERIQFRLHIGSQSAPVVLPVAGRMNVQNALAAAAVGWALERPIEEIANSLSSFEPPEMRMQTFVHPSGAVLINDAYNANPSSMLESIRSLVETYPLKKRVLILGSMLELGNESEKWHFHVGSELGKFEVEKVFLLGEEMKSVQTGAISVGAPKDKFEWISDHQELVGKLKPFLKEETVLLFKGSRGIQLEKHIDQIMNKQKERIKT